MDFIRNDNASTVLSAKNLTDSSAAVDDKGRLLTATADIITQEASIATAFLGFEEITANYTVLFDNTVDLEIVILLFINFTDTTIVVSYDGENSAMLVPSYGQVILDLGATARHISTSIYIAAPSGLPTSGGALATVTV